MLGAVLLLLFLWAPEVFAVDIAVVVNASGPLVDMTKEDIRDIYLGDRRFEGNVKITPFNYPEGPVRDAFLRGVVGMSPKGYRLHWARKVFREGLAIPRVLDRAGDVIRMVRTDRGGIGYLPRGLLKDKAGIKVIMVSGE